MRVGSLILLVKLYPRGLRPLAPAFDASSENVTRV